VNNKIIQNHVLRGRIAERHAARFLVQRGYEILVCNYYTARGEIDLVARDRDCLVFVEVKQRSNKRFGSPESALTPVKRRRLWFAAQCYLKAHPWAGAMRFDVVAISGGRLRLYRNALEF